MGNLRVHRRGMFVSVMGVLRVAADVLFVSVMGVTRVTPEGKFVPVMEGLRVHRRGVAWAVDERFPGVHGGPLAAPLLLIPPQTFLP